MKELFRIPFVLLTFSAAPTLVVAHNHMPAGVTTDAPGGALVYAPTAEDFTTTSGFVFGLNLGTTNDAYLGYYWTEDAVFGALAVTPSNGGPEPGHPAPGSFIQIKLLSVEGPAGASFGFWENAGQGADGEGIPGTNLTWSVTVPYQNGTNLIAVSESDGAPGSDPYGHIHGRVYTVTKPGYYKATWQFVDTSTNGPGGTPIHAPSAPFSIQYQADLTIGAVTTSTNTVNIVLAAPSFLPDDASPDTQPATYTLQSSVLLGLKAQWQAVGETIPGDDQMHTIPVPMAEAARFFRLVATYPPAE